MVKEDVETETIGKELSELSYPLITKDLMDFTIELLKTEQNLDGRNLVLVHHGHQTQLMTNASFQVTNLFSETFTTTLDKEEKLQYIPFVKMNMIKFMVLLEVLMVLLKDGVLILQLDSTDIVMIVTEEVALIFYVLFL